MPYIGATSVAEQIIHATASVPVDRIVSLVQNTLRSYQSAALFKSKEAYQAGCFRQLIVLPTGMGKTICFAMIPQFFGFRKKMMVLVHRDELASQAADKIKHWNPHLTVGIEMGPSRCRGHEDVVVASVPTIGVNRGKKGEVAKGPGPRLLKFNPQWFDCVVTDEAHHSAADSYKEVYKHFGFLDAKGRKAATNPGRLLVGVTATPERGDNKALKSIFDEIVYQYPIFQAMAEGWLVHVTRECVFTTCNLDKVKKKVGGGDFDDDSLSKVINTPARNALIVNRWLKTAKERPTIAFSANVKHAEDLAAEFSKHGIKADHVSGKDKKKVRRAKLKKFESGETHVLVNCGVLVEGYDCKRVSCIVMARPTTSKVSFTQKIGRGTRLEEGINNLLEAKAHGRRITKPDCLVIEIVDQDSTRNGVITLLSNFDLPDELDMKKRTLYDVHRAVKALERLKPDADPSVLNDIDVLELSVKQIALFEVKFPDEVLQNSQLQWYKMGDDSYQLTLPNQKVLRIHRDSNQCFVIEGTIGDKEYKIVGKKPGAPAGPVIKYGDGLVFTHCPQGWVSLITRDSNAPWRKAPSTDAQRNRILYLHQNMGRRVIDSDIPRLTKGEASLLITRLECERAAARAAAATQIQSLPY